MSAKNVKIAQKPSEKVIFHGDLAFVDRYRPKSLKDIVGNKFELDVVRAFVDNKTMKHLLICGPAGTGKTTSAIALARDLGCYNSGEFLEINASADLNRDVLKHEVKKFAALNSTSGKKKIILLDECDHADFGIQQALRRIIEIYSDNCIFILTANYPERIIEPLQSRCVAIFLRGLNKVDITLMLNKIIKENNINILPEVLEFITSMGTDMRSAINLLEKIHYLGLYYKRAITMQDLKSCVEKNKTHEIIDIALSKKFTDARSRLIAYCKEIGSSEKDIVNNFFEYISGDISKKFPSGMIGELILELARTDATLSGSVNPTLQLCGFIAKAVIISQKYNKTQ